MKNAKVVLIGSGAVGTSFLYSAMNQGLSGSYGIIDVIKDARDGNVLDFEDVIWRNQRDFKVHGVEYKDLKNTKYLVITAGRPQKPGETRLQLIEGNVQIMKEIAKNVKASGFKGYTIIASNPVDVMTYTYWKTTGFPKNKVIGSGTILDTARLRYFISEKTGVSPKSVQAFILGEHGDSSVVAYSQIKIEGIPFAELESIHKINSSNYEKILEEPVRQKAYEIINRKKATFYGIGASLASIVRAIMDDSGEVLPTSALLEGQYGIKDVYTGVPTIINKNGADKILEIKLNKKEKTKFEKSAKLLKEYIKKYV